jgi:hypothetical protein
MSPQVDPEDGSAKFLRNVFRFSIECSVISQKTAPLKIKEEIRKETKKEEMKEQTKDIHWPRNKTKQKQRKKERKNERKKGCE